MVLPYAALAKVYDRWVTHIDYGVIASRCRELVSESDSARVLDLCTGTGTLALLLAVDGAMVVGVDRSKEMLAMARKKLEGSERASTIRLAQLDVGSDEWPSGQFDLIVAASDSASYLDPIELAHLVRSAGRALTTTGSLLFDLNSDFKLRQVFGNSTYAEMFNDYGYIWINHLAADAASIEFEIHLFMKGDSPDIWTHQTELHRQYVYDKASVVALLESNGFKNIVVSSDYGGNEVVRVDTHRWVFCAKR